MKGTIRSCDIIIPIWNQKDTTRDCLEAILRSTSGIPFRLILIDNGSEPDTRDYLRSFKDSHQVIVRLIENETNLGFIKAVNQGLKEAEAEYICVMNNDTIPGTGWLDKLIDFAEEHPETGLLNPLCNGHGDSGMTVDQYALAVSNRTGDYMEMNQCQGYCMLIKKEVLDKIGYLDERFGLGGFDDTDYSMRAHLAGYTSVSVHSSYVYHKEHSSFMAMGNRKAIQAEAEKEYFRKWPRHLRVLMVNDSLDPLMPEEAANLLRYALFAAREWCWVNAILTGNSDALDKAKTEIRFPSHQNIKFRKNKGPFPRLNVAVRIIERCFGTKSRKKYDIACFTKKNPDRLLVYLLAIAKIRVVMLDLKVYNEDILRRQFAYIRGERG